ncbi:1-deoxy-D-xylulose 5-phosphate reductoisomerase [Pseudorhodobacter antarcticus]|uniref:1-deoxy-D-xylulose 5-phosphate reductoisomerase n=1 Tax=Pseudorhodobacter antarcticus TaxID=1077947 RepID=A0A1H8DT23_9RHOB|nr:1-deoxy-D-xylulose-5-phosphate reductoisomerase [Pseudorhodobacter antarcticus]SEN09698.1 1-deoxy-D-xylulose 5-phosphate reductoisomerase [Pseudorhodobacter antarcticus]
MRSISIFGATGSIGESTFDLIMRGGGPAAYRTVALTGARNIPRLAEMARALQAEIAVTAHDDLLDALRDALAGTGIDCAAGAAAIADAADRPADWVMSGIVGAAGLVPGLRALRHGGTLALANKESLVTAGPLLMATAAKFGATLLPVDSEHSAVFQALVGEDKEAVERVIITASGGPFRSFTMDQMHAITPAQAVAHPNWSMGQRISIDSASMFNKALELIETREFFGFTPDQIEVIVHPQSIIHALVGFTDGGIMAHLGPADMRHAIGYALHWPQRGHVPVERLNLAKLATLNFEAPDPARFPALRLARDVMETRGLSGAAFNAAKEIALDGFIAGQLPFLGMAQVVETTLSQLSRQNSLQIAATALEDVLAMDHLARKTAAEAVKSWQAKT